MKPMNSKERRKRLSANHLLDGLEENHLHILDKSAQIFKKEASESIFHQGDQSTHFYFVIEGAVKLFKISSSGNEKVFEVVRANHFFAEATVFFELPVYPVSATAITDTQLMSIDSGVFLEILEQSSVLCIRLLGKMSQRLHKQINEINNLSIQNASYRVAYYLLHLHEDRKLSDSKQEVHLRISKKIIASRLSIQPETLSRILTKLDKQGFIEVLHHSIIIKNIQGLRNVLS